MKSAKTVKKVMLKEMCNYIDNVTTLDEFISKIKAVTETKNNQGKGYWFRFFNSDTGATTVLDIERDLNPITSTKSNREHMINSMKIALINDDEFTVHFS